MLFLSIDSFIVTGIIRIACIISFSVKISINIFYFNIILIYKTIIKQFIAYE